MPPKFNLVLVRHLLEAYMALRAERHVECPASKTGECDAMRRADRLADALSRHLSYDDFVKER